MNIGEYKCMHVNNFQLREQEKKKTDRANCLTFMKSKTKPKVSFFYVNRNKRTACHLKEVNKFSGKKEKS